MAIEWERRGPREMTSMYLGRTLEKYLGYRDMARRAREGHFDDYFAPKDIADGLELHRLIWELQQEKKKIAAGSPQARRIDNVIQAVVDGEFDGTREESERWAASKDGQETFRQLLGE